ncbi:hypothetical protein ACOSQ2_010085 [Xanthoceras sorbifolium]
MNDKRRTSTRPSLLEGSNYMFWKAHMRAYVKANDECVWIYLSRFPNKAHGRHKLEFWITLKSTVRKLEEAEESDDGEEMAIIVSKFKMFLKGKRIGGGFKGANAKKDFVPRKFDNDKDKGKGV